MSKELTEKLEALELELNASNAINAELTKEIETLKTSKNIESPAVEDNPSCDFTFTHEKVKYGFNFSKISIAGKRYTAEEISLSKELQAKLVKLNSSMLKTVK